MKKPSRKILFLLIVFMLLLTPVGASAEAEASPAKLNLSSQSAVLMDAKTGVVLYDKGMNEKQYPASITKIMTALLLIEYTAKSEFGLRERIFISGEAVNGLEAGSSNIGMRAGETLSLEECLYAILLASANEVAAAVAEHIAGGAEEFAVIMNSRAAELGALNTHFTNPHGLPDENHYTTAYDMALIMREAVRHEIFAEAISTAQYIIPGTEYHPEPRILSNKNSLLQTGGYIGDYVIGGKTGYTSAARHTLATYAVKNGEDSGLICVMLRAENYLTYPDTIALIEYGFGQYVDYEAVEAGGFSMEVGIEENPGQAAGAFATVAPETGLAMKIPAAMSLEDIKVFASVPKTVSREVRTGDVAGKLTAIYGDVILGEVNLVITDTMAVFGYKDETASLDFVLDEVNETDIAGFMALPLEITRQRRGIIETMLLSGVAGLAVFLAVLFVVKALRFNGFKAKSLFYGRNIQNLGTLSKNYKYK